MSIRAKQQVVLDGKSIQSHEELEGIYRERLKTYGATYRTFAYTREAFYTERLAYASKILHATSAPQDTVLDLGCGTGNLVPFFPRCRYTGIDLMPEFIQEAHQRFPDLVFLCGDVMEEGTGYDWIVMVGLTGLVLSPESLIEYAWLHAEKGLVIDFVDSCKDEKNDRNTYDMGACTDLFLDLGAQQIAVYRTRSFWNIFVVRKHSLWV
jgi:SAM-dependent methyltransferase